MAADYGTLQWYQSRRSSAAHRKIEKEIEIETENYPSRHYNQPRRNSGIYGTDLKNFSNQTGGNKEEKSMENLRKPSNIHESIDQKMTEIRRIIADMKSKQSNHFDFSSKSVSNQQRILDLGSQQHFCTKSVQNYQVSFQSSNSNSYKKYNMYSALELDDRRDRGLCLWCDELFYEGHECCKKILYVFEIDTDEDVAVGENNLMEPIVDVKLVEKISHCDNQLIVDCVQKDSNELSTFVYGAENGSWEASEVLGNKYKVEDNALQVYEEMSEKSLVEIMAGCMSYTICLEDEILNIWNDKLGALVLSTTLTACWLDLMVIVLMNPSPKDIDALFNLLSRLRGLHQPWVAWPELPLPPPEPPPRFTSTLDCNKSLTSKVYKRRTIVLLPFTSYSITMERYFGVVCVQSLLLEKCTLLLENAPCCWKKEKCTLLMANALCCHLTVT